MPQDVQLFPLKLRRYCCVRVEDLKYLIAGLLLHQNRSHHWWDRCQQLSLHPQQQHLQPEVLPRPLDVVDVPYWSLRHRTDLQIRPDDDP